MSVAPHPKIRATQNICRPCQCLLLQITLQLRIIGLTQCHSTFLTKTPLLWASMNTACTLCPSEHSGKQFLNKARVSYHRVQSPGIWALPLLWPSPSPHGSLLFAPGKPNSLHLLISALHCMSWAFAQLLPLPGTPFPRVLAWLAGSSFRIPLGHHPCRTPSRSPDRTEQLALLRNSQQLRPQSFLLLIPQDPGLQASRPAV